MPSIILDEPTEGLTVIPNGECIQSVSEFCRDKTVIMVTHREAGLSLVDVVYGMRAWRFGVSLILLIKLAGDALKRAHTHQIKA